MIRELGYAPKLRFGKTPWSLPDLRGFEQTGAEEALASRRREGVSELVVLGFHHRHERCLSDANQLIADKHQNG